MNTKVYVKKNYFVKMHEILIESVHSSLNFDTKI
jgi:hypothetical protein